MRLYVTLMNRISRLLRSQRGQSITEYALILALIAVVVIAIMTTMGSTIKAVFTEINNKLGAILNPGP